MTTPPTSSRLVVVLTTGGTISSRRDQDGEIYVDPALATSALTGLAADMLPEDVRIETRSVFDLDSSQSGSADIDVLIAVIHDVLVNDEVTGIVVTHGTDTLEETAMAIDLVHDDSRPVVITGAQRPADDANPDGLANVLDAVLTAADPTARNIGVLVVFGRAVLQARGTRKWHTTDDLAFAFNGPESATSKKPRILLSADTTFADSTVSIITAHPDIDPAIFDAAVRGSDAVIIEGLGSGNIPEALAGAVIAAFAQRPNFVCAVTTRVPRGAASPIYAGAGGGANLLSAGALTAQYLRASQARVLLQGIISERRRTLVGNDATGRRNSFSAAVSNRWAEFQ